MDCACARLPLEAIQILQAATGAQHFTGHAFKGIMFGAQLDSKHLGSKKQRLKIVKRQSEWTFAWQSCLIVMPTF